MPEPEQQADGQPKVEPSPTVVPFLAYEDGVAAIDFLTRAFGFAEQFRLTGDDGSIGHAELRLDGGVIYLTGMSEPYQSPYRHAETCEATRRWLDTPYLVGGVFVQVDDIHAHFDRAMAGGATILSEVEDAGHGIIYRAADPEGQRWMFSQRQEGAVP
ncbi:MAG: VOC family protein [Actinopolymorphaceae bacterium]